MGLRQQFIGRVLAVGIMLMGVVAQLHAQEAALDTILQKADSLRTFIQLDDSLRADMERVDSLIAGIRRTDSLLAGDKPLANRADTLLTTDSLKATRQKPKRDWATWTPDPQRAMWLAMVLPGAGQIYNRKYWKLPLIYGGFIGCIYAMSWNNMMYKDYAQAYLDIMDSDPGTASYNKFLHLGRQITSSNEEQYKTIFKKRKDRFRRYRDMSFFVMVGVYALTPM